MIVIDTRLKASISQLLSLSLSRRAAALRIDTRLLRYSFDTRVFLRSMRDLFLRFQRKGVKIAVKIVTIRLMASFSHMGPRQMRHDFLRDKIASQ